MKKNIRLAATIELILNSKTVSQSLFHVRYRPPGGNTGFAANNNHGLRQPQPDIYDLDIDLGIKF